MGSSVILQRAGRFGIGYRWTRDVRRSYANWLSTYPARFSTAATSFFVAETSIPWR